MSLGDLLKEFEALASKVEGQALRKAMQVEAFRMKQEWRENVRGTRGLPGLAAAVSYDVTRTGPAEITAEVGYDKTGQGNLGNLAEFGSSQHGPIRPTGARVVKDAAERAAAFLADLGADL